MTNRFATGWVELPSTPRMPHPMMHRPDPDLPGRVMCERVIPAGAEVIGDHHGRIMCPRCNRAVGSRKEGEKRAKRRAARLAEEARRAGMPKDDLPRAAPIRVFRAGLPGLGKR